MSRQRVPQNTDEDINRRIERDTQARLMYFREHPDQVRRRLAELDAEWDIERVLETVSSGLTLTGLTLGLLRGKRWLLLPLTIQSFFLQHALQGWCPPLPVLRRLGFRTVEEIEAERQALDSLADDSRRPRQKAAARGKSED